MKKQMLFLGLLASSAVNAQTTLFQDDFEAVTANWVLNGGSGANSWLINEEYDGFPLLGIQDTPNQPTGITGGPLSTYVHITNSGICGAGICNANFDASQSSNQPLTSITVNCSGNTGIAVSFWYLSNGEVSSDYGQFQYSTNNGMTWTTHATYQGVNTWTQVNAVIPALDNQAQVKIRFNWINDDSMSGLDAPFSIDDVKIIGNSGPPSLNTTTNAITQTSYCAGVATPVSVNFNASGAATSGNVYTAQLSNASGSFASPTAIGTLASTASGPLSVSATIPASTPVGTAYRIRVVASAPSGTSGDNGADLAINAAPIVAIAPNPANGIMCAGQSTVVMVASGADTYVWSPGSGLSTSTTPNTIANPAITTQYTVVGTAQNGCTNSASFTVTVQDCASIDEEVFGFEIYPNPAVEVLFIQNNSNIEIESMQVIGMNGQLVSLENTNNGINVSKLSAGQYILLIQHSKGISKLKFTK
jgi:hypothetical protein